MKNQELPNVPIAFTGSFPNGYRPWIESWSVDKEMLLETLSDGTFTMSQLDISINDEDYVNDVNEGFTNIKKLSDDDRIELTRRAESQYKCEIGCEHCFECRTDTDNLLMTIDEVFQMLHEAKDLGLKNVKFLGPGELMNNPKLFEILDFLQENNINIGIFTKGLTLGGDEWANKIFGMTAIEICEKIASYENVTILLGLESADRETQNNRIASENVHNLFDIRNKAFENLATVGMNSDINNQRLALMTNPVLKDNIDEIFDIYKWAIERNIPVIVAPTMVSGKGGDMPEINDPDFKEKLVELYTQIYVWLIREEIFTLSQVEEDGIAPYPGYACNQFISGMFIRKDGRVQACPGNESSAFRIASDVRTQPLKKVWKNSIGYRLREQLIKEGRVKLTQPCYAKSEEIETPDGVLVKKGCGSFPERFYERVLEGVRAQVEVLV